MLGHQTGPLAKRCLQPVSADDPRQPWRQHPTAQAPHRVQRRQAHLTRPTVIVRPIQTRVADQPDQIPWPQPHPAHRAGTLSAPRRRLLEVCHLCLSQPRHDAPACQPQQPLDVLLNPAQVRAQRTLPELLQPLLQELSHFRYHCGDTLATIHRCTFVLVTAC